MLIHKKRTSRGFSLVEILVAVALIAVLTAVGALNFFNLQSGASDSSTQQQLRSVKTSLELWIQERGNFTTVATLEGNDGDLQKRIPDIDIVGPSDATGEGNGRALKVSFDVVDATTAVIAAHNGSDVCWAIKIAKTGTTYAGKVVNAAGCTASAAGNFTSGAGAFQSFGFPQFKPESREF